MQGWGNIYTLYIKDAIKQIFPAIQAVTSGLIQGLVLGLAYNNQLNFRES